VTVKYFIPALNCSPEVIKNVYFQADEAISRLKHVIIRGTSGCIDLQDYFKDVYLRKRIG
jgi:hypothetical protein